MTFEYCNFTTLQIFEGAQIPVIKKEGGAGVALGTSYMQIYLPNPRFYSAKP